MVAAPGARRNASRVLGVRTVVRGTSRAAIARISSSLGERGPAAGPADRIENDGDCVAAGHDIMDRIDDSEAAEQPDLDRGHRDVGEHRACLGESS